MDSVFDEQRGEDGRTRKGSASRLGVLLLLLAALIGVPVAIAGNAGASTPSPRLAATACTGGTYTVVKNDGWWLIATKLKISMATLLAANGATVATVIHPGDVLCVPAGGATTSAAPSTSTTTAATPSPTTAPASNGTVAIRQFPVQGPCWYTDSWGAPRSGGRRHLGVDILAATGQLVYASDDGILTKQYVDGPGSLSGNGWRLTRADGTYYFYGHFSRFPAGLKVGSAVKAGQIIGYVGMTGNAGAPHLHWEVHPKGGAAVNPTPIVKAVDGCRTSVVPAQPGAVTSTTSTATTPTTKPPVTTTTKPPVTTTTKPAVTPTTKPPATTTTKPPATTTTKPPATVPAPQKWQFITPVMAYNSAITGQRLQPSRPVTVSVAGLAGVTPSTKGVMVRLLVRNIGAAGSVTVHACGSAPGATPTLRYAPDRVAATVAMAGLVNGSFCLTASSSVDVRVAVMAQLAPTGSTRVPSTPRVALNDVRLAAGGTTSLSRATLGQPAGSKAVAVQITLRAPDSAGSIGVGACGGTPWIVMFPNAATQTWSAVMPTGASGLCVSASVAVNVTVTVTSQWVG